MWLGDSRSRSWRLRTVNLTLSHRPGWRNGRRTALKMRRGRPREGSNPSPGTERLCGCHEVRNQPHMRGTSERTERTAKELAALNAWRRSILTLFAASVLLGIIVVATAVGSRRPTTGMTQDVVQAAVTPQSLPTVPAGA